MASRVKEDEKKERVIRGLLKLSDNRRCINCNSLGPQYVCTNFWTFVCTTCSGIHREFTHRVKSVSMAKFTSEEVAALKEGGNKRAREIYFKEWDHQRQNAPDSSNVERLRGFIKHVYVDRRFSWGNYGKPPSFKTPDRDDNENKRTDLYRGGSRSPPYEDGHGRQSSEMSSPGARSDDRNSKYSSDGGRSPGYDQDSRQYNDYGRSPSRPGIINDWRREDRFGNGLKVEGDSKQEGRSPERPKDAGESSPPVVRPVKELLGDNVIPLHISEPPKANAVKVVDTPPETQRTSSSSSLGSSSSNPVEVKVGTTASLIDFFDDPEPTNSIAPQAPQTTAPESIGQPENIISHNNWASFDVVLQVKVSQASSSLESSLLQLSAPSPVPGPVGEGEGAPNVSSLGNAPLMLFDAGAPAGPPSNSLLMPQPGGASADVPRPAAPTLLVDGGLSFSQVTGYWPGMQLQQPALFPASSGQSNAQQSASPFEAASGNEQRSSSTAPAFTSAGALQASATEVKLSGRKELPEDLFTMTYPSYASPFPGWQTGQPGGPGFTVHYGVAAMPMPTVFQSSKSMNPFDIMESGPAQAQTFPSMTSLQGALQNIPASSGLLRTSSLGAPAPAWTPPQSSPYSSVLPSQASSYGPAMPPRAHMMQQIPINMALSGHQGIGDFGEGAPFGTSNVDQQLASGFAPHAAMQPFPSAGGNPFG